MNVSPYQITVYKSTARIVLANDYIDFAYNDEILTTQ